MKHLLVLMGLMLMIGCASGAPKQAMIEPFEADRYKPSRCDVTETIEGYRADGLKKYRIRKWGTKFDMSLVDSSIREALLELSMMSSIPIVFDEAVSGAISANISQMTFEEILELIIHAGPFDFKRSGGFYYVGIMDPQNPSWWKLLETHHYKTRFLDPTQIYTSLDPVQKKLVTVDEKRRTLMISAPRSMMIGLIQSISKIDRPNHQILLELTITELSQGASTQLGKTIAHGSAGDYFPMQPAPSPSRDFTIMGNRDYHQFLYSIQAFVREGEAEIKARPSLLIQEGDEAVFNSNQRKILIPTNANFRPNIASIDTGVLLKVTPYLSKNGDITLKIKESGSSTFDEETSDIQEHKISTTIIVRPGESVMFGGMIQQRGKTVITKIPLLGDIPLLGNFFRHTDEQNETKEVIFAIRPRVVCKGRAS